MAYDPVTLVYKLFEQDDGKWRVVQDSMPKIVSHAAEGTSAIEIDNYKQTVVVDPALAWWVSGSASADKGALTMRAPKIDQTIDFGPVSGSYKTTVDADGAVSTSVSEEINDIDLQASPAAPTDGKASAASGRLDKAAFRVGADGLKTRKAFDLVSLLSAHRADLAPHEAELKSLLRELAAPGLKFAEGGEATKLMVSSPFGAIALAGVKLAVAIANAGPQSAIEARLAAEGLSLPVALAPPGAADLTPSKIDLTATLKGIDIAAGANEAITDMQLGGPGPDHLRREFRQGRGGFPERRPAPDRARPVARGRAGDRRRRAGGARLCDRQAVGPDDDPHARLRQDDGGGQGARPRQSPPSPSRASPWPRVSPRPRATGASPGSSNSARTGRSR